MVAKMKEQRTVPRGCGWGITSEINAGILFKRLKIKGLLFVFARDSRVVWQNIMKARKTLLGAVKSEVTDPARIDAGKSLDLVSEPATLKSNFHKFTPHWVERGFFLGQKIFDFVIQLIQNWRFC